MHAEISTAIKRYSVGTKNKDLKHFREVDATARQEGSLTHEKMARAQAN